MIRQVMVLLTLAAFLNVLFGCSKTELLSPEAKLHNNEYITAVIMPDGTEYVFSSAGGEYVPGLNLVRGVTRSGEQVEVKLEDALYVQVKRVDVGKSLLATVGITAGVLLTVAIIVAATKESCPFVYSWNGAQYVFDAEPLGGAVCEGMKRTDYSRLEHLKAVDGEYRLLIRNEVEETQYLDGLAILAVDHPAGTDVFPDTLGNMFVVSEPVSPTRAVDGVGGDLLPFVTTRDSVAWQSHMPALGVEYNGPWRHELTITFPRPVQTSRARLLLNAGTTLWGSNMVREVLALRGNQLTAWYDSIAAGGEAEQSRMGWMQREELWMLKLQVETAEGWQQQGFVMWAGPLIIEDRAIALDLTEVEGDSVTIRLNPPFGFWTIDYLAIQYDYAPPVAVSEVPLSSATDQYGDDVTINLAATDGSYHVMPEVNDWTEAVFADVLPEPRGQIRSLFLRSTGYYQIHVENVESPQQSLLTYIGFTPNGTVKWSVQKYQEWLRQLVAMQDEQ